MENYQKINVNYRKVTSKSMENYQKKQWKCTLKSMENYQKVSGKLYKSEWGNGMTCSYLSKTCRKENCVLAPFT